MNDPLIWRGVHRDIDSALQNLADGLAAIADTSLSTRNRDHIVQHSLQSGYTSIESAIKKIFAITGEAIPLGADWHKTLLQDACEPVEGLRPSVFSPHAYEYLDTLRSFRHVAVHGYDSFRFKEAQASIQAANDASAPSGVRSEISRFIAQMDGEAPTT